MSLILLMCVFNLLNDNIKKGFVEHVVGVSLEDRAEYCVRLFLS